MQSRTTLEISISCLSWINEQLREQIREKEEAEALAQQRRFTVSKLASAVSAAVLGALWIVQR